MAINSQDGGLETQIGVDLKDGSHFADDFCFHVRSFVEYAWNSVLCTMPVLVGPAPTYVSKNFREGRMGTFFSADLAEIQRTPHLHGLSTQLQQLQPFCRRLGVAMQAPIIAKGSEDLFAEVGEHPSSYRYWM